MNHFIYISIFVLIAFSCRAKKEIVGKKKDNSIITAESIIKAQQTQKLKKETIDARLSIDFKTVKENIGFSVRMKININQEIWLRGSKAGLTIFKARITPEKIGYYSSYKKNFFEGDFTIFQKILGIKTTFAQLQNLLIGQTIFNLEKQKHNLKKIDEELVLFPINKQDVFNVFYHFNYIGQLKKQEVVYTSKGNKLTVLYPEYTNIEHTNFPKSIIVEAKENTKHTIVDINVKSVIFNSKLNTRFSIPSGYKRVHF